ncbi:VWA domain-containing protein, partial [Pleurocapsales cyanobacterium LEGE 10410]|nr:VWA domain-containing protein [Pleurocapsales cyanobacterium LEGE 10410]
YTLNISPYQPDTQYNIACLFDTSASMDAGELQIAKDAYTELINYYIDTGVAENSNFAVVSFSKNAIPYFNLSAQEAITTIQSLTTAPAIEGTKYNDALYQGLNFLSQSPLDASNTSNIAYFVTDGRSQTNFADPNDQSYVFDAMNLRGFANVQAFGINENPSEPGAVTTSQLNFVDSNDGVVVDNISNLSTQLNQSGLADDLAQVNILVDGQVVETITPDQLTDSPLGLTYEGTVSGLDVSVDAENVVTAEVVFTPESNLATTTVDYTITAGEGTVTDSNGNPLDESGNQEEDPFEQMRNGGDSDDEIKLGYADLGANGGAGGDYIVGNRRDNVLDGGAGNDTIAGYAGNDTITTGTGRDRVNGGEGIDTVVYSDVVYQGNNISLRQTGSIVNYQFSDTLTDVEFLQFADVRVSTDTLEVTPVVQVEDISVAEGDLANTFARFNFELDTPAPVDVAFNYSTEDLDGIAGEDYVASSGQVVILAGETTASVEIEVIRDTAYDELTESFALNLSGLSGATFANNETEYGVVAYIENDDSPNSPPILENAIPDVRANEDELFEYTLAETTFSDVDAEDSLTYTASLADGSNLPSWLSFEAETRTFSGTPINDNVGTLSILVTATDNVGESVSDTFDLEIINVPYSTSYVNVNGAAYTDAQDRQWYTNGFSGVLRYSTTSAIAQTEDDLLYQTQYYGQDFSYNTAIKNGVYDVTLSFAELFYSAVGQRVFDVSAEDQLILDDLDVVAEAGGKDTALDRSFTVEVTDGSLNLDFLASVDKAMISAIEIEPMEQGDPIRLNANGSNYADGLGQQWSAYQDFNNVLRYSTPSAIAQTEDDLLYQTQYYGQDFSYNTAIDNGVYDVTLSFAELFYSSVGQRVFDVSAEDQLIIDDLDVWAEAGGKYIALDKSFTVEVTDGSLDLDFLASADNAIVSAIAIEPSISI